MMARAGVVLEGVVEELKAACREGVRTIELDRLAERRIRAAGARPGFLGYHGFPNTLCISINRRGGAPASRASAGSRTATSSAWTWAWCWTASWADMGCTVAVGKVEPEARR